MQKIARKDRGILITGVVLLAATGVLQILSRTTSWFGSWYVRTVYPWLAGGLGWVFGWFPFSVVEFALYGLVAGIAVYGIVFLMFDVVPKLSRLLKALHIVPKLSGLLKVFHRLPKLTKRGLLPVMALFLSHKPRQVVSRAFLLVSVLLFAYTCNCGINYYAESFSSIAGFSPENSSVDDLYQLCGFLLEQAKFNETAALYEDNRDEWKRAAVAAMKGLGSRYPSLDQYYPGPKEVTFSQILSVQHLAGVYSPFTVEANFNGDMVSYHIPHTICHELSHLTGFMREDEANFIGYLACIGSENQAFRYSGYMMGWQYASNALAKVDAERYMELRGQLSEQMVMDLAKNNAFWHRYDGKVATVSTQINDTYLKINSQQDGVLSYGRVVDLMLVYYRQEQVG